MNVVGASTLAVTTVTGGLNVTSITGVSNLELLNETITGRLNVVGNTNLTNILYTGNIITLSTNTNLSIGYNTLSANTGTNNTGFGNSAIKLNTSGTQNTAFGGNALLSNTTTSENTAIGYNAIQTNTAGNQLTAVGCNAMQNASGIYNTAIGYKALCGSGVSNTGSYNTAIGWSSLGVNQNGAHNVGFGLSTLSANTSGGFNMALGSQAMKFNQTGSYNMAIGVNALMTCTNPSNNSMIGSFTAYASTISTYNTIIGADACRNSTAIGSYNTVIGTGAFDYSYGKQNTIIGGNAVVGTSGSPYTGGNNIVIGYGATSSTTAIDGETTIGTTTTGMIRVTATNASISSTNISLTNTTVIGSLNVTGGPLTVGGGTTLGGTLNVTGTSTQAIINASGLVTANAGLTVSASGMSVTGPTTINGQTSVEGSSITLKDNGTITHFLQTSSATTLTNTTISLNSGVGGTTLTATNGDNVLTSDIASGVANQLTASGNAGYNYLLASGASGYNQLTAPNNYIVGNIIQQTATTDSISATTGALQVAGGLGVAKSLFVGGQLNVVNNAGMIKLYGTDHCYIEFYYTNTTRKAYLGFPNASSVLLDINNSVAGGNINIACFGTTTITCANDSAGSTTGALVVSGGVGIAKNLNVGGNLKVTNAGGLTIHSVGTATVGDKAFINLFEGGANWGAQLSNDAGDDQFRISMVDAGVPTDKINIHRTYTTITNTSISMVGVLNVSGAITGEQSPIFKGNDICLWNTNRGGGAAGVAGGVALSHGTDARLWINATNAFTSGVRINNGPLLVSTGSVTAVSYFATSDKRIKTNITDLNCPSLDIIRKIRPCEYNMIDGKGKDSVYGFVAQEIKELIPKSVQTVTEFIPSVYENAFVDGNKITLINKTTTDISCCKLKIRNKNGGDIIVDVTTIHDNKIFYINGDITQGISCMDICGTNLDEYTKDGATTYKRGSQVYTGEVKKGIFVYGIQVDDFHTLDKDTIWTVTLSATKELDTQLQLANSRIADLEQTVRRQQADIDAIKLRLG